MEILFQLNYPLNQCLFALGEVRAVKDETGFQHHLQVRHFTCMFTQWRQSLKAFKKSANTRCFEQKNQKNATPLPSVCLQMCVYAMYLYLVQLDWRSYCGKVPLVTLVPRLAHRDPPRLSKQKMLSHLGQYTLTPPAHPQSLVASGHWKSSPLYMHH